MSKESIRASIESKKADIARIRTRISQERSRKSEANARYSANIKNAKDTNTKARLRGEKASVVAHIEANIRNEQLRIESLQRTIAQLREQLKNPK